MIYIVLQLFVPPFWHTVRVSVPGVIAEIVTEPVLPLFITPEHSCPVVMLYSVPA